MNTNERIYGLMAEFMAEGEVLAAAQSAYERGYRNMDAFVPYPVDGLAEALGRKRTWVPPLVLAGGLFGGIGGYFLQWYALVLDYPLNIGGRPYNSWPLYIPITFELTILLAACSATFGMLVLNRLPEPYHPVFNVPGFERASVDRFFLCLEARDPVFDLTATRRFLETLGPMLISEVAQ